MANPIIHKPGITQQEIEDLRALMDPMVIIMTPVEGETVSLPATIREIILNLEPATDLESVNLILPTNDIPREGQRIFVSSARQIEQLTATSTNPVNGGIVMYSTGDNFVWLQNKGKTWSRVKS